jgi:hypothetical protein
MFNILSRLFFAAIFTLNILTKEWYEKINEIFHDNLIISKSLKENK